MASKKETYALQAIQKIHLNSNLFRLAITSSPHEQIEIEWTETSKRSLSFTQSGNVLKIEDKVTIDKMLFAALDPLGLFELKRDALLVLKIPAAYTGSVICQTKEETINAENLHFDGKLGIATNTGKIMLKDVQADTIDIRGNLGEIKCYDVDCQNLIDLSTERADILCDIADEEKHYTTLCQTKHGRTNTPNESGNGSKKLRLTTITGNIEVQFADSLKEKTSARRYNMKDAFEDW